MRAGTTVIGTGLDLQPLARVARLLDEHAGDLGRVFTTGERAQCDRHPRWRVARYAAAYAAKEAVMKAIGSGWTSVVDWPDIDTAPGPAAGAVHLQGGAERAASARQIRRIVVSTAVTRSAALATAVALGDADA